MQQFIEKYADQILGVLSGFDRLVFRGTLRSLSYRRRAADARSLVATGMEQYLWNSKILFKDYKAHVKRVSEEVRQASLARFHEQGLPIKYLNSSQDDKQQIARAIAIERGITTGPICALSILEPSPTFDHRGKYMVARVRPCQVLYHYQIDPQLGWMYARIQTWFPFNIQVGVNGREWLSRQMEAAGMGYHKQDNCFAWVEDYARAQALLDEQLQTRWPQLLDGIAGVLNPLHEQIFAAYPSQYYWTCYASEWATDIVFGDGAWLKRLMAKLVRHSVLSYSSADVMRYWGQKPTASGQIPKNFARALATDMKRREEGERVKFRMNRNSLKFYDKAYTAAGNVLRAAETTICDVDDFRVYRPKEGGPEEELQWRRMRRGVADLHRRTTVSQKSNERLIEALAAVDDTRTVQELTLEVQKPAIWSQRRVRALRPWGDDHDLLSAVNSGEFLLNGFRNRDLQAKLYGTAADSERDKKRRSAAISRKLRMLRAHGLIQKVFRTHRYQVTDSGRAILLAVLTSARTSVAQLDQVIAKAA